MYRLLAEVFALVSSNIRHAFQPRHATQQKFRSSCKEKKRSSRQTHRQKQLPAS